MKGRINIVRLNAHTSFDPGPLPRIRKIVTGLIDIDIDFLFLNKAMFE